MQANVVIANIDQIKRALAESPIIVAKHIDTAIKRSILTIQRYAVKLTPVDTGRLRGSYNSVFSPLKGILEPTAKYAIYVHEGTSRMQGRPFLTDGIDIAEAEIQREFEIGLENALNEIERSSK